MALAVWQATIVNGSGDVQKNATIQVKLESTGALAAIYSDRDGENALDNPFVADSKGFARFYAAGGAYRIDATLGSFSQTYRHQSIGLLSESDSVTDDKIIYRRTAAEITAGVTPEDYSYQPGDVRRYGADPTGVNDSTSAFEDALAVSKEIYAPAGTYDLTGLAFVTERTLRGDGYKTVLNFSGSIVLEDVRKVCIRDCLVNLTASSTTLIEMSSGGGAGTFECFFQNVVFSGTTSLTSTIGLSITDAFINTFVNCHFIWFDTAIQFNTEANRNNFFGCTIRSSLTYGTVLIDHNAGQANSFTGCDLENCNSILDISGGSVFFGEGCYFEAHNEAFGFQLSGGHVSFSECYFNEVFFRVASGGSMRLANNWIKGSSLSNASSPLIRLLSGFTRLILEDNIQEGATYLLRANPTVFNYLQVFDEGGSSWGSDYPDAEHIYVRDTVYDVTGTARTYVEFDNVRQRRSRSQNYIEGQQRFDGGSNGVQLLSSAWNYNPLRLGSYYLWVDSTGDLRIKSSAPSSDTDGTVVGTQS